MKSPQNTQKLPAAITLLDALMNGPDGQIERMEAKGQRELVESSVLPTDMTAKVREILEGFGVQFLGGVPGDPLFQYARLPEGWRLAVTDHSMWSELRDGKDRVRAKIFYKAAFYDRRADLHLVSRFSVRPLYDLLREKDVGVAQVLDGDTVIHETAAERKREGDRHEYDKLDRAASAAEAWLVSRHPDWRDLAANWS